MGIQDYRRYLDFLPAPPDADQVKIELAELETNQTRSQSSTVTQIISHLNFSNNYDHE